MEVLRRLLENISSFFLIIFCMLVINSSNLCMTRSNSKCSLSISVCGSMNTTIYMSQSGRSVLIMGNKAAQYLPVRKSEQGNVIGSVHIYTGIYNICVQKKLSELGINLPQICSD